MAEQTLNPNPNLNLKDTRESKGLTLEIVHEATKIPLDALKAIEQGYSVRILTPFYYRGFIKIYAEFLGLNVQDVFRSYNVEKPIAPVVQSSLEAEQRAKIQAEPRPKPIRSARPAPAPAPKRPVAMPRMINQGQEFVAGLWTPQNRALAGKIAAGLIAIGLLGFAILKISGCVADQLKKKPKAKVAAKVVPKPVKAKAPAPVRERVEKQAKADPVATPAEKAAPAPAAAAAPAEAAVQADAKSAESVPQKVQLVVRALRKSWIQVKADGNVVFGMNMQKGTMETWTADREIELSGRNIGEMEIEVNGKSLGKLGATYRGARKVLITKDGVSVRK